MRRWGEEKGNNVGNGACKVVDGKINGRITGERNQYYGNSDQVKSNKIVFFFKQKAAYEISACLVGSVDLDLESETCPCTNRKNCINCTNTDLDSVIWSQNSRERANRD